MTPWSDGLPTNHWAGGPRRWRSSCAVYRCSGCGYVWRQDTTAAAEPRATLSRRALRWALEGIVVQHLTVARVAEGLGVAWAGVRDALAAAEELRQAANLVDRAYDRLAEGFIAAGRIAWHPDPAVEDAAPSRWVNVVFLQGDEADRPLRILGEPHIGYVSLLRRYTEPGTEAQEAAQAGPSPMRDGPELLVSYSSPGAPKRTDLPASKSDGSWFEPAKIAAVKQARGLGL